MISVIIPVYNEADNLRFLMDRLFAVADKLQSERFEFIMVDDCSADATPQILKKYNATDKRVRSIRFAKNAGSHAAISAGMLVAKGDAAVVMAADLQDPPELIIDLWKQKQEDNVDVVWGVRAKREKESFSTRFFSRCYYLLVNILTSVKMPPTGADVYMISRQVMDAFNDVPEKHGAVHMAVAWLGFSSSRYEYVKAGRKSGVSKWTLRKKLRLLFDSIFLFSHLTRMIANPKSFNLVFGVWTCAFVLIFFRALLISQVWIPFHVVVLTGIGFILAMALVFKAFIRTRHEAIKNNAYRIEYQLD